jgi:hypothetical protein
MALDFYDVILEAAMEPSQCNDHLHTADKLLTKIRLYIRLSHDLHCLSFGQFEHAAVVVDEIGRLLGGWQKQQKRHSAIA